jgi:hypothetical protein
MAYGFGTGVQAGLGATDYSNYLRAALSGAQMEAQGTAAIGQGIQNALGSIGSGIAMRGERKEKMAERDRLMKEQEKMQTGQIKASANIFRGLTMDQTMPEYVRSQAYQTLSQLDNPYSDTAEKFGIASQASETVKGLLGIAERGEQTAAAEYSNLLGRFNGNIPSMVDTRGFTETQKAAAGSQYLNRLALEAKSRPKQPDLSFQEQAFAAQKKALEASLGREANDQELALLYQNIMRTASPSGDPAETARMNLISNELPRLGEAADSARRILPNLSSLQKKLDAGLKTGKLEDFKTGFIAGARSIGIPIDETALGSAESARAQFGQFLLEYYAATKGAITDRENELFASMGPQFSKSNEANKDLLSLVEARLKLDLELGNIYRDGLSGGMGLVEINRDLQKARNKFEEKYNSTFNKLEDKYVTGNVAPGGTRERTYDPVTETFK